MEKIMRNYVLHEATSRQAYGRLTLFVRMVKNWRARKAARALLKLDDYLLRDIGLTRGELDQLICRPLSTDMQWEAERVRLMEKR
jgi:uncharacterized protein YjiS (DUF1127 family)